MANDARLSKKLAFWLRHRPDAASLALDEQGWTDVDGVLAALAHQGTPVSLEQLRSTVKHNDKQRFEFSPDGSRIRARQGHSIPVELDWPARVPPERLYHGTVQRFLRPILAEGLRSMQRHHVHLSPDVETARRVGARRGAPVILAVHALRLHEQGQPFFLTGNNVWLTSAVPPRVIEVLEGPARLTPDKGA